MSVAGRFMAEAVVFYQRFISPLKPKCCRFEPTCSQYSRQAFLEYGFWRGFWLTICRVARCHPFYHGCLYDPVPPRKAKQSGTADGACQCNSQDNYGRKENQP